MSLLNFRLVVLISIALLGVVAGPTAASAISCIAEPEQEILRIEDLRDEREQRRERARTASSSE